MHKKTVILISISIICLFPLTGPCSQKEAWQAYKNKFISNDGRIIDYFQDSISHSEGQGYGLLLSLMHDDQEAFDRVLKWSLENLQVRRDALFAWAWGKRSNGSWMVINYNNASDGDILIAFALINAAKKWHHQPYMNLALTIIKDIRTLLALHQADISLIMPGYYGFQEKSGVVLNTGYLILPAFSMFYGVDDTKFWTGIYNDSLKILKKARFSSFKLPSDWILIQNGNVSVYTPKSSSFGYEAIRIPLYMIWDDNREGLEFFSPYLQFVQKSGYLPNRVNLINGSISINEAPAGFYAVFGRCAEILGNNELSRKLLKKASDKITQEPNDYFSHTLYLLSKGKLE